MDRAKILAALTWASCAALLAGAGVVQGGLSGRWSTSPGLDAAVARLDRLPRDIGAWKGEDLDTDRATFRRIGIDGGVVWRYRDASTGAVVTAMLLCGRPGPVSVHTPDICYAGAGYEIAAPPSEPVDGFRAALMRREGSASVDRLHVYWSWNASGRWEAPSNPRVAFGARPYLYKFYVIRTPAPSGEELGSGPAVEFLRAATSGLDLLPESGPAR